MISRKPGHPDDKQRQDPPFSQRTCSHFPCAHCFECTSVQHRKTFSVRCLKFFPLCVQLVFCLSIYPSFQNWPMANTGYKTRPSKAEQPRNADPTNPLFLPHPSPFLRFFSILTIVRIVEAISSSDTPSNIFSISHLLISSFSLQNSLQVSVRTIRCFLLSAGSV